MRGEAGKSDMYARRPCTSKACANWADDGVFAHVSQTIRQRLSASQKYQADVVVEQQRYNDILERVVTQRDQLPKLEEAQTSR